MHYAKWLGATMALAWTVSAASAGPLGRHVDLKKVNACLQGQVIDYTHNHHTDHRIWSAALCEKRDLYVYLPPCFDPNQKYPLVFWMHAFTEDEHAFVNYVVYMFDEAIASGCLPPMIIVAPDASIQGRPSFCNTGSFYINSPKAGNFEDFIMCDVWNFMFANFPLRPEREAHALIGASMGGFGAYNLGIKYRDRIKIVAGVFPALNLRYVDCHGKYHTHFDPCCFGWREHLPPHESMARFFCIINVRMAQITWPLYGCGHRQQTLAEISAQNPAEMLAAYCVQPGELCMFAGYGGKDEFNIGAQVESFVYMANQRGLHVTTEYLPDGRHDIATGQRIFPAAAKWLAPLLAPYAPGFCGPLPAPAAPAEDKGPVEKLPAPKEAKPDAAADAEEDPFRAPKATSEESELPAIFHDIGRVK